MGNALAGIWAGIVGFFHFFKPVGDFITSTGIPDQIQGVKYRELFTNPWFLVPYLGLLGWNFYKKQLNTLIIILLLTGSWAFFGTPYMRGIVSKGEVTLDAILPLVFGACVVLGVIVYLIFFKSE